MITIKQQTAVSFHHVDVKDGVIMAPLMNRLCKCIAAQRARELKDELPEEEKQKYDTIYRDCVYIADDEVERIFDILSEIGFVATEEYSPEEVLASYLKKD